MTKDDLQETPMLCPKVKKKVSNWDTIMNTILPSNWYWEDKTGSWKTNCKKETGHR